MSHSRSQRSGSPVAAASSDRTEQCPTPAVIPIASAPQKVTRQAPDQNASAANPGGDGAQQGQEDQRCPGHPGNQAGPGANAVTASGSTAPTAKLAADASAA